MYKHQKQVKEFMQSFKQKTRDKPFLPSKEELHLRCKLLVEEVVEFCEAAGFILSSEENGGELVLTTAVGFNPDLIKMVDALADIQYVNDGAANCLGVDLEPVSEEVHRSNMSKLQTLQEITELVSNENFTGKIVRIDPESFIVYDSNGKVVKSPSYSVADIKTELEKQGAIFATS